MKESVKAFLLFSSFNYVNKAHLTSVASDSKQLAETPIISKGIALARLLMKETERRGICMLYSD